jgi:hypothetical protein
MRQKVGADFAHRGRAMASSRACLSPNEETTLRRIAMGMLESKDVRQADATRLTALALIKEVDGLLIPTSEGLARLKFESPREPPPGPRRRLKSRRLSF